MRTNTITLLGLIVAVAAGAWMYLGQPHPRIAAMQEAVPAPALVPPPQAVAPAEPEVPVLQAETTAPIPDAAPTPVPSPIAPPEPHTAVATPLPKSTTAPKPKPASSPARNPKPPLQDPTARVAMSFVGADPEAGAYWLEAIFDSTLPEQEREDLMEDLNEEGLSDHKRPGPDDFPLIMNRIALIEGIVPDADEFMLPHLWEAYKDLVNLAEITQGGGRPVR